MTELEEEKKEEILEQNVPYIPPAPDKPESPNISNVTHYCLDCSWKHVRDKLPKKQRYKFLLQELSHRKPGEWNTIYTGFGITKNVPGLDSDCEFTYRLIVQSPKNVKSEPSDEVSAKTEKEPLTGDTLHKAISKERVREVEEILESEHCQRIIEIPDKYDHFPLMIAVLKSNVELVELLIYKGANVDNQNESGKTALMLAAFYGRINIIRELKNNGASYDKKDKSGSSILHYAIDGGNLDAIQFLLMDGHLVDPVDNGGWTPLIRLASMNGSRDAAEILVRYNANLDIFDDDKKNALIIAVLTGNLPLVESLIDNGADLTLTNEYGKTAYDIAVSLDKRKVIRFFEEHFSKKDQEEPEN